MVPYPRLARFNYLQRPKTPLVCILRRNQGGGGVVKQPTLNSYCLFFGPSALSQTDSVLVYFILDLLTGQNKGRDPGHKSHFRFCNVRTNSYEGLYDT